MFRPDLVVRGPRVVLPAGIRPAALHIHRGKIVGVMELDDVPPGCPVDDAAEAVVMPGVVDTHVHVNGNFETATRAAAAGGVTTIVTADRSGSTRGTAEGKCFVDVAFWGVVARENAATLGALAASGVRGFKSDVETDLRPALPVIAKLRLPLLLHAVLPGNSKQAENDGIARAIELCRSSRVRTHILHLSSSDALTPLYRARASRLPISAETCPHYLTLVADDLPRGASASACNPPIRERENREYLWASLAGGLIQMVVSDHPHVTSVALSLATTWAEARARGYSLNQLVEWMCRAPARLAGLDRKGAIDVGFDADLIVWNGDSVERTYLRGIRIYERGGPVTGPAGILL